MNPQEYCRSKVAPPGSAFHYCLLFAPEEQASGLLAWRAVISELREGVLAPADPAIGTQALLWWRRELSGMLQGNASHPSTRALLPHLARARIGQDDFIEVLESIDADLNQSRYLDFAGLLHHCGHCAVEQRVAARLCNQAGADVQEWAGRLGAALQLMRRLLELGTDVRRGRLYLPVKDLQAHDCPAADILQCRSSPKFERLMDFELRRAASMLDEAIACVPATGRRALRPLAIEAGLSLALCDEVIRGGYRLLEERTALTPLRMLWIGWTTAWKLRN